jgi:prolyl oligopeptidase
VEDVVDTLAGVSFPDPYRWLEVDSEEVRRWQRAQAALATAHVREWPQFERLRQLVERFSMPRYVTLPRYAGGRWFRMHAPPGAAHSQAVVSDEPLGAGRVVFDPAEERPDNPPFLSWIAPSPDGRILAVGVCMDGSENNTIRLINVATGSPLAAAPPQTLMDNWTGGVQWLPDSSGFFFSALAGVASDFEQHVYLHRRSPQPSTIVLSVKWTEPKSYRTVTVARDGRHAVAVERLRKPIPVAIGDLRDGLDSLQWRPFITTIDGTVAGHVLEGRYVAVTDVGSPRGRLVSIPLEGCDANDPDNWRDLVGQSTATLRTATPVGEFLYLTELSATDAYARVRIVDVAGRDVGEVPLPAPGAIVSELPFTLANLLPKGHPEQFLFGFSSLTLSTGLYRHAPGEPAIEILQAPQAKLSDTVVENRSAVSADGTRIPYHIVRRADLNPSQPQPTLIWAYGGFNLALVPQFPGPMAAFVAAGGVFVHAHLRGGGEFGLEWWQGGRKRNKQNCYDDLFAVAEDLIAASVCTSQSLAVTGGSNGGLMAGVAATQRPALWRAVVPRVPVLDLIGHNRYPYGRMMFEELVDVEDSEDVRRLATFSPYHLVREGVAYPAVFLEAGDTDPRAPAWHARKFAARLQRASSGAAPVLLHVWENVGHGFATDRNIAVLQNAEWLAFTLQQLGVHDWQDLQDG